jgi:branched-subunit amino acid transport protein
MDRIGLILAVAAITYLTRVSGFYLGRRPVPYSIARFLVYVPVAAFATLIASGLDVGSAEMPPRLVGLGVAAVAALRFRQLWAGIAAGMLGFWIAAAGLPDWPR